MKGMDGPISDQAKEDLTTSYQNSLYAMILMSSLGDGPPELGERSPFGACQADGLLGRALADWKKQGAKDRAVEVTISAPEALVQADEMLLRQCVANCISYVAEFVQESLVVSLQAVEEADTCLFTIRSTGKKLTPPPECDLTMYGYIVSHILELHQGVLRRAEEDELGAVVEFSLPKA
jgi:K+-sensing histidine kinase KdpD